MGYKNFFGFSSFHGYGKHYWSALRRYISILINNDAPYNIR